jgi:hypothetical protein
MISAPATSCWRGPRWPRCWTGNSPDGATPHADLGWFCAKCWRFGNLAQEAGGIGARAAFHAGYEAEAGSRIDTARLPWWELLATIRWAVIAADQAARHLSGQERSLELALTGHIVPELEWDILAQVDMMPGRP